MWDGIMFFGILAVAMAADSIGPARCGIGIAALLLLRMSGPALAWLSAPLLPKQQAESNVKAI